MKLFFNNNKEKLTTRKPKEDRTFIFSDKAVREYDYDVDAGTYSDRICKGLKISVSRNGNHSFFYSGPEHSKVIGSIYNISVDKAREICKNIKENEDEFNAEFDTIKLNLYGYFQKFGPYPHNLIIEDVTEETIEEQIETLKKQVDILTTLNDRYLAENERLKNKLAQIHILADIEEDEDDDNVA